ncbi:beta-hydroxyacyl-ACP dehydratase, putative [Plasmodium knowlesi strain H]|uniref:3-hydroxyacyl-[acyl-carrier-protein] dehydratase n=3 Tax=Plasmodium knowlesi TaxID=5850 RepID=A0A5K1V662_PLAKH|nr:beta-hydroxyacyl-ACP dehydratase, putative [Plasmodium knowlesi strain H]OTN65498.1 putative Beta-hydroxyacyl-ACP dehydratase [Plasmodium knowlesi]CAA9989384.1 beta-hydroxyacyl-ACP dehydratase, putative [Plasmodium knowlesi strain H]SBO24973.1 beta-hydroxyacyl-ACP dehydratase, putative [Plasmodium knowlesi strain H]SBO27888.1 beta-hydroxyacyl-ACP dehydratase, putative [Plasmodium knowlesi strain H]VVS78858.1 beta-hydroxyacyl-ACP dehydratase, putative [Plasmodium knowlesi strain H]|eukprot:XP_002260111.1 beta-hydroxyacyl-acp dehydratase precursor,putative [Plasmodium knowlesi strain H]
MKCAYFPHLLFLLSLLPPFATVALRTTCLDMQKHKGYQFLTRRVVFSSQKRSSGEKYKQRIGKKLKEKLCAVEENKNKEIDGKYISFVMSYDTGDTINIEEIKNVLPHRYPFLLVDKVIHIERNKKIIGIKQVSANEEFFNGHFPAKAIMPGVLQIEALAQLGGILCLTNEENRGKDNLFLFAGVDGVRWKKPVVPGDTLVMEVEQISFKPTLGVAKLRGCAYVGGHVILKVAEMTFALAR